MSEFKLGKFKIIHEASENSDYKVVNFENIQKPVIKEFELNAFNKSNEKEYKTVKEKYGPLASTDHERRNRPQKDRRFSLNPLLRDPLSIEAEEMRAMDERVRARVEEIAQEVKSEADLLGYQEGLKKGYQEAFDKFNKEATANLEQFNRMVAEAESAKLEIFRANERFLMEIIFKIGRTITLKELSTDSGYVLRLATELIGKIGVRDHVTLLIHPDDIHTIELLKEGLSKAYDNLTNLKIVPSPQVRRGGCKVETHWNVIDASIDTQIEAIYDALVGTKTLGES